MLHNIKFIYLHCVFHGIRFKVNNEDWLSVRIAFFCFAILGIYNPQNHPYKFSKRSGSVFL